MIMKTENEWVTCENCKRPKHKSRACICEKETHNKPQESQDADELNKNFGVTE